MSVKPRTIDNLGPEVSVQYAENQKLYDPRLIEESRLIPQKTQISSVKPYIPSDIDTYFMVGRGASWALFTPPPDFAIYGDALFSYQIIPSLGPLEKQEADTEKLEHLEDYFNKQKKRGKKGNPEDTEEKETLLAMLRILHKLDKVLALINARRNQYQRG